MKTENLQSAGGTYARLHRRKKKRMTVLTVLAAVVTFCTIYALILPAITLENTTQVNSFYLWLWQYNQSTTATKMLDTTVTEALSYTSESDGETYYLIPVSYFEASYNNYEFDETETDDCPFTYAPSAYYPTSSLTVASYVEVDGSWYVQVQDTTGETPPRSNIYYTAVVETETPSGTVIDLFDYWTTTRIETDVSVNNYSSGINENHVLKFKATGLTPRGSNANVYTGSSAVFTGIVNNLLTDGFPTLTLNAVFRLVNNGALVGGGYYNNGESESLDYLFDTSYTGSSSDYRAGYHNVAGLLQVDEEGYYYYDSTVNYAEFHENEDGTSGSFTVYDAPAVENGEFFPFNDYQTALQLDDHDSDSLNHYLGMSLTTRFLQQYGGKTSNLKNANDMVFEFSGDDDVWIFIDGVLVGDVGGIHAAASITINFATGVVTVNGTETTTIYDAFVDAGKADSTNWTAYGNTYIFEDGTYHTLKFFYLERGSSASNLKLKYNLNLYPETSIYKVNQYGDAIEGATFAVYAADSEYHILEDAGSTTIVTLTGEETYDSDGNIVDSAGNIVAKALYTGTTDANGELTFVDGDEMPYTLSELEEMFGEYFILREIAVPEGYRAVSEDTLLQIYNHTILICNNTYESGTYAAPSELISAPGVLLTYTNGTVDYYDGTTTNGTLFAVVMKYVGSDVGNSTTENQALQSNWAAVYGDYTNGFSLVDITENTQSAYIQAAIDAALQYDTAPVFSLSSGGMMQLYLTELPGDIRTYYAELDDNEKEQTEYIVSYFWSSASSLSEATTANTWVVNSFEDGYEFSRVFGTTIKVPNLTNSVQVKKLDPNGNMVNGATFAIYSVEEFDDTTSGNATTAYYVDANGNYFYLTDDGSGNNTGTALLRGGGTGTYVIATDGVITLTIDGYTYTINPLDVQTTAYSSLINEEGTASFENLQDGYYYVREVDTPLGYQINTTEMMVAVSDEAVLANAGTADDGVQVARGTGYLAYTLDEFAAEGVIDNTLSWIYANLRVSDESSSFAASADHSTWGYITQNYWDGDLSTLTLTQADAIASYLQYDATQTESLYNYVTNADRGASNATGTRRLFTEVGWSYLEIYQDTEYGLAQTNGTHINYTDLSGTELTALFSRTVYIRVTDQFSDGTLEISKTVKNYDSSGSADAPSFTFTVDLTDANGDMLTDAFSYTIYDVDSNGTRTIATDSITGAALTGTITSGGTVTLTDSQVVVIDGIPYGTQYTVTETENAQYSTTAVRDAGLNSVTGLETSTGEAAVNGTAVSGTLYWLLDGDTLYATSTVDFTNTWLDDLAIYKVDGEDGTTPLAGAVFSITKTVGGTTYYFSDSGWTTTESTVTTNAQGYLLLAGSLFFAGTADANTYTITEVQPPDGYELLASTITMTINESHTIESVVFTETGTEYDTTSGGNLILVSADQLYFTVTNESGYELPHTGGMGTARYLIGGVFMMLAAVLLWQLQKRIWRA